MIAQTHTSVVMLRNRSVTNSSGVGRSTLYNLISEGLFTKPVCITSKKAVAWPSNEVYAINAARIAGQSETEIRELVTRLHAGRTEMAKKHGGDHA
jgi:prophage regulatory protein